MTTEPTPDDSHDSEQDAIRIASEAAARIVGSSVELSMANTEVLLNAMLYDHTAKKMDEFISLIEQFLATDEAHALDEYQSRNMIECMRLGDRWMECRKDSNRITLDNSEYRICDIYDTRLSTDRLAFHILVSDIGNTHEYTVLMSPEMPAILIDPETASRMSNDDEVQLQSAQGVTNAYTEWQTNTESKIRKITIQELVALIRIVPSLQLDIEKMKSL